jgi:hypothetical protein
LIEKKGRILVEAGTIGKEGAMLWKDVKLMDGERVVGIRSSQS